MRPFPRGNIAINKRSFRLKNRCTIFCGFCLLLFVAIVSVLIFAGHIHSEQINSKDFFSSFSTSSIQNVVSGFYPRKQAPKSSESVPATAVSSTLTPPAPPFPLPTHHPTAIVTSSLSLVEFDYEEIHFVHIPKCGGTTMTAVLRQIQCQRDTAKNSDCCLNPGFCDWHAFRRCASIKGCINHFPQRLAYFTYSKLLCNLLTILFITGSLSLKKKSPP